MLTTSVIAKVYELKNYAIVTPDRYLGGNVGIYEFEDGSTAWYASAEDYL